MTPALNTALVAPLLVEARAAFKDHNRDTELGILEAAHPILSKAFRMFCKLHGGQFRHGQSFAQMSTSLGYQSLTRSLSLPSAKLSSKWCTVTRLQLRVQETLARLRMRTGSR